MVKTSEPTSDLPPRRHPARGLRLRLLALRPDGRSRRPSLVRGVRDGHHHRARRHARADARRVVAAGSRATRAVAVPDPPGLALPVRRPVRRSRGRRLRSGSTATRSRRRSTRSSGGTSRGSATRATRCSSSCTSRARACRGCSAPGTRRSTTRRRRLEAGDEFGRTTCDGTGPFTLRRVRLGLAPRRRALGRLPRPPRVMARRTPGRRTSTASAGSRSSTTASALLPSSAARWTASRTHRCSTSTGSRRTPTSR